MPFPPAGHRDGETLALHGPWRGMSDWKLWVGAAVCTAQRSRPQEAVASREREPGVSGSSRAVRGLNAARITCPGVCEDQDWGHPGACISWLTDDGHLRCECCTRSRVSAVWKEGER